jgi:hypothetical protein
MELASEGTNPPLTHNKTRRQSVLSIAGFGFGIFKRAGLMIASIGSP